MSSLSLGTLYVQLNAETKGFAKGFADAATKVEEFSRHAKKMASEVAQAAGILSAVGGVALHLAETVNGPTSRAMDRLQQSTTLLAVQVADLLLPAVRDLTDMFNRLAHFVAGLDPHLKKQIATWAEWVALLAVGAKALQIAIGLGGAVAQAFGAMASAVAAVGVGPIIGIIVALGAVVALVALVHRAWRENWAGIQESTGSVLTAITDGFKTFFGWMLDGWKLLIDGVKAFVDHFLSLGDLIEKITGKNLGMAGIHEGINGLFKDLKSGEFFTTALDFGKAVGTKMVAGVKEEWGLIYKELGIDKLVAKVKGTSGATIAPQSSEDLEMAYYLKQRRVISASVGSLGGTTAVHNDVFGKASAMGEAQAKSAYDTGQFFKTKAAFTEQNPLMDEIKRQKEAATLWGHVKSTIQSLGEGLKVAGQVFLSKLGDVGQIITSGMQGFEQGGPMGALFAVIAEFISRTQSFSSLMDVVNGALSEVLRAIDPVVGILTNAVKPIVHAASTLVSMVLGTLAPILQAVSYALSGVAPLLMVVASLLTILGPILGIAAQPLKLLGVLLDLLFRGIYELVRLLSRGVLFVVSGISGIWNGIVNALAGIVDDVIKTISAGTVKNGGDFIRQAAVDMSQMDAATAMLATTDYDAAKQVAENGAANDAAAKSIQSVSESLTNIPTGFKVALARMNASEAMAGVDTAGFDGGGMRSLNVENLIVKADNPAELHKAILRESRKSKFRKTGRVGGDS